MRRRCTGPAGHAAAAAHTPAAVAAQQRHRQAAKVFQNDVDDAHRVLAQLAHPFGENTIRGDDHAAFPGREDLP